MQDEAITRHVLKGKIPTFLSNIRDKLDDETVWIQPCECDPLGDESCEEGAKFYWHEKERGVWMWKKYPCNVEVLNRRLKKTSAKIAKQMREIDAFDRSTWSESMKSDTLFKMVVNDDGEVKWMIL